MQSHAAPEKTGVRLFVCGDVMTGRGVDQILPHPSKPQIHESCMRSALGYVALAEQASGPIRRPVPFAYPWGDALGELDRVRPHARIVNLETAVSSSEEAWPDKGINYRMHPANVGCLVAARIDCCVLANNHVLDWGYSGLEETLAVLATAGMRTAGAGADAAQAEAPAAIPLAGGGRVLVFACGLEDAGVPPAWAAGRRKAGVSFLADLSARSSDLLIQRVHAFRQSRDLVVISLHWGGNWGYRIRPEERAFARRLIDAGAADLVHGHSSHHPRAIEIHRNRPILYGCGDFLNDYEGISGHAAYRPELTLMYFPVFDPDTGALRTFELCPMRLRALRAGRVRGADARWLADRLDRESQPFGTRVLPRPDERFTLHWTARAAR